MSNLTDLLEKASILLTPTAYDNGLLNSVKPASGENLLDYSEDFSQWSGGSDISIQSGFLAPDGTSNAYKLTKTGSSQPYLYDSAGMTTTTTRSIFAKTVSGTGTVNLLSHNSNTNNLFTLTEDWQRFEVNSSNSTGVANFYAVDFRGSSSLSEVIVFGAQAERGSKATSYIPTSGTAVKNGSFDFTRSTIATRVNEQGLIEDVTDTNLPRIDYLGGTGHLLLEPQSTNTATYSNDFTQGDVFNSSSDPSLVKAVLTSQQAISPDGTNNAWLLKDDNLGGSNNSQININSTNVTSNDFNTLSIFAKKALTSNFLCLQNINFDSSGSGTSWFNISNGTLGTINSNHTAKIEDYGNGWYRCQITFKTTTDLTGAIRIRLASLDNSGNVTRDGTNGLYLFGLQCEASAAQNYATSYIPTSGSTVTRNEDVCNNSGSSDLMNGGSGGEGVFYVELAALTKTPGTMNISLSDNSQTERIVISTSSTENQIISSVNNGNAIPNHIALPTVTDLTAFNKIAIKHKLNDLSLYINGSEEATDTSVTIPDLSSLQFDNGFNGTSKFFGKIKCVAVYKEALTDAQLTALTT